MRTVLLVEDDEPTRSCIQRFLERDGYDVVAVDAAEEGIVEAGELMPDVLISDIHLPGLSGIELASFLLAQDPALPVILMTGDPDEELARRAIACGPVHYLLKPFEWFEMEAAVGVAITQRENKGILPIGTAPVPALGGFETRVQPEWVSATWDVPDDPAAIPDDPAAESADPAPTTAVEALPVPAEASATAGIEWSDTEPLPDAEVEDTAGIEWSDTPLPDAEVEDTAGIEWSDPQPLSWAADEPFRAETDWVDVEPIGHGDAEGEFEGEAGASITWIDLEQVSDGAPFAMDAASTVGPEPQVGDPETSASEGDGEWLDQIDRASYAGPGHGDRVSRLVLALHAAMDEPGPIDPHDLGLAARVHEAGRLHVPDADPVGIAVRGAEVLAEAGFPAAVTETVRHMHERWDGSSGPDRLSGSRVPMGAQMLAVADALDHYSSAWIRTGLESGESARRAMSLVTAQQNVAFSPIVVGAMLQATAQIREICMKPRSDMLQPSPIPALAAAEAVPFALFASD